MLTPLVFFLVDLQRAMKQQQWQQEADDAIPPPSQTMSMSMSMSMPPLTPRRTNRATFAPPEPQPEPEALIEEPPCPFVDDAPVPVPVAAPGVSSPRLFSSMSPRSDAGHLSSTLSLSVRTNDLFSSSSASALCNSPLGTSYG